VRQELGETWGNSGDSVGGLSDYQPGFHESKNARESCVLLGVFITHHYQYRNIGLP